MAARAADAPTLSTVTVTLPQELVIVVLRQLWTDTDASKPVSERFEAVCDWQAALRSTSLVARSWALASVALLDEVAYLGAWLSSSCIAELSSKRIYADLAIRGQEQGATRPTSVRSSEEIRQGLAKRARATQFH